MTELDKILPKDRLLLMDLVKEAGVDVSDWANCKGGAVEGSERGARMASGLIFFGSTLSLADDQQDPRRTNTATRSLLEDGSGQCAVRAPHRAVAQRRSTQLDSVGAARGDDATPDNRCALLARQGSAIKRYGE